MKKSTKIIRLSVTLLLLIAMLLTPMSPVFAVVIENGDADLTAADIVSEDASKREKFSRHYLTGDGTYFAVSYAEQVNYQDEDGNWIAVDNSLSTNVLTGEKSTKNEKFKVKFANKANDDDLVTIKTKEYDVSFGITVSEDGESYLELNKVKGTESASNTSEEPKTTREATSLGKAVSGITYFDAFSDYLDVRYSVAHEKVKEDLILERKSGFNSYKVTYNIKEKDALATLNDDGSITFTSPDGAVLFNVGVPVMYDSDGKSSADIAVSMVQTKKTVEVTYIPSAEWLNAEERVYPVTIDPEATSNQDTSNITDFSCYFCYEFDNINFDATTLYMGMDYHTYIKFDSVPTLSENATLLESYLGFYGYDMINTLYSCYAYISSLDQYWDEYSFGYYDGYYNENNPIDIQTTKIFSYADNYEHNIYLGVVNDYTNVSKLEFDLMGAFYSSVDSYVEFYDDTVEDSSKGFLIAMCYEYDFRAFSSEFSNMPYRPYVYVYYSESSSSSPSTSGVLPNGEYYFRNSSNNLFLNYACNMEKLTCLENQKLTLTYVSNGYYRIATNDGYLKVSDSLGFHGVYPIESASGNHYWKIEQTSNGNYTLGYSTNVNSSPQYYLSTYSDGLVSYAIGSIATSSWEISQSIDAIVIGNDEISASSFSIANIHSTLLNYCDDIVYSAIFDSYTKDEMKALMQEPEIFIFFSHGSSNGVLINSTNLYFKTEDLPNSLSNLDLALIVACETGANPEGFLSNVHNKGATYACGFTEVVEAGPACNFADVFVENYLIYNNAYSAVGQLDGDLKSKFIIYPRQEV